MARRRAAGVSPAGGAACVVVVFRAPRHDDRGRAARRRRSDQRSRADRRGRTRQEVAHSYAAVSGAAAQVVAGQASRRSRDARDRRGRSSRSTMSPARSVFVAGRSLRNVPLPRAIAPGGPYNTPAQRAALARFASSVADDDGRYPALRDILARTPPRIAGRAAGVAIQTTDLAEQRALTAALDQSYLFIQGPPGTGKTWTGARLIIDLIRRGRRVGVTATSHKAIHNLLRGSRKGGGRGGSCASAA